MNIAADLKLLQKVARLADQLSPTSRAWLITHLTEPVLEIEHVAEGS